MNVSWIVSVIIFALVAVFLIGVFLCWTGSAYRKKIYYICVTLWEAAILTGYCIDSMTDEDGYYRRIAGKEAVILAVLIVLMVCILISYLKNRKLSSVFHIFTLMWINIILYDGLFLNFCSSIFLPLFIITALLAGAVVYRTDRLAEVLPGAFLGGNIFGFIASSKVFCIMHVYFERKLYCRGQNSSCEVVGIRGQISDKSIEMFADF